MTEETETRMIVIAPSSEITPDQLARFIHGLDIPLKVKETCYGAVIDGKKEDVERALDAVRRLDPHRIFSKIRAYPAGDTRRCRAHHGSRPGFSQLEMEWKTLSLVDKGLEAAEKGEHHEEKKKKENLSEEKLKEIISEVTK